MQYLKRHDGTITRIHTEADDGWDETASIPPDPRNQDYVEFLEWEAEQETPLVAEPAPPPDPTVAVRRDIEGKLDSALGVNIAYLGLSNTDAALLVNIVKQQRATTRQLTGLIRLQRAALTDTEGA